MEWLLLALALLLILGTGVFVAAEFSLLTLDKHTVDEAVARGDAVERQRYHASCRDRLTIIAAVAPQIRRSCHWIS